MRTTTACVLVLCLMAGIAAAQEHGAATQPESAKAATKAGASSKAAQVGTHDAAKPPAKDPPAPTAETGKAAAPAKAHSAQADQATAHASPSTEKPAAATKAKTSVVEPPISESDRHAADAAKDAHLAVNKKDASAPERAVPARVPVDELAVRLQRVLDAEAARKKTTYAGGHAPTAKSSSAARKAPQPKAPPEPPRPGGVTLNWGSASAASHVKLAWEQDVDPRQLPRQAPSGARLSWEADRP